MGNSLLIDDHSFWKNIRTKVLVEGQSVSSVAQWCLTFCNPIDCSTPGFPVHHQLPELAQNHVHWVGDAIQPSHPLLSPSPPAFIFPSIRIFSNESVLGMRWPKYWSFNFSISLSNEHSGLIRIDRFDLLAVQGILKSLLQFENISSSVLSLLYGPTLKSMCGYWKNHSLDYMDLFQENNV